MGAACTRAQQGPVGFWLAQQVDGMSGHERRVLLVGPVGAGKRSMLHRLRQATEGPLLEYYRACKFDCFAINSWDTSSASGKIRTFWQHYYVGTSDLVVVVDSSEPGQILDVKEVLAYMLDDPRLADAAVLVFANKQDLHSALSPTALSQELGLPHLRSRSWHVQGCSVTSGEGVIDGWRWLEQAFASRGHPERDHDDKPEKDIAVSTFERGYMYASELEALVGPYIVTSDDLEVTAGEVNGKGGLVPWRPWSGVCVEIGVGGPAPLFLSSGDYVEILEAVDGRKHLLDFYGRISWPVVGWIPLDRRKLIRPDFIVNCQMVADEGASPTLLCTNLAGCKLVEYCLRCPDDETVEDVLSYLSSYLSVERRSLKVVLPDGQLLGPLSIDARVMDVFNQR